MHVFEAIVEQVQRPSEFAQFILKIAVLQGFLRQGLIFGQFARPNLQFYPRPGTARPHVCVKGPDSGDSGGKDV